MQRPSSFSPEQPEPDAFVCGYQLAWEASGKPERADMDDVFFAAFDGTPCPHPRLHALWIFFRSELEQNNVAINRFFGEMPVGPLQHARSLREACKNTRTELKEMLDRGMPLHLFNQGIVKVEAMERRAADMEREAKRS